MLARIHTAIRNQIVAHPLWVSTGAVVAAILGGASLIFLRSGPTASFASISNADDIARAFDDIRRDHPSAIVERSHTTSYVNAISNLEQSTNVMAGQTGEQKALSFIESPSVSAVLGRPSAAQLRPSEPAPDPFRRGYSVIRVQQYLNDVRIFGGELTVSVRNGQGAAVNSIAASAAAVPVIDLNPAIEETAARNVAAQAYAALRATRGPFLSANAASSKGELIVFDPRRFGLPGDVKLCWRTRVGYVEFFVDAKDGRVDMSYVDRPALLSRKTYDCNSTDAICSLVIDEHGFVPPGGPTPVKDARDAHSAAAAAHDYFKQNFNRDGFDDEGMGGTHETDLRVRVGGVPNALWDTETMQILFAPGWTALDIAAHEYTHAVSQFGPALVYLGEAGSVNEFFSDFFAAMVKGAATGHPNWLIGENVLGFSTQQPVRSMSSPHNNHFDRTKDFDPQTNGGQPEHFDEKVTMSDRLCASVWWPPSDNGCVHFNSGILNKAAVLASDGGTFRGVTVTGMGRTKLSKIMFGTLMTGITPSSGLRATADAEVVSCNQLVQQPALGITSGECQDLDKSLKAVGLR